LSNSPKRLIPVCFMRCYSEV